VGAYQKPPGTPTSTEAILAVVLGAVGFTACCFPISFAAYYFGSKARKQAREQGDPSGTNANLGLVGMILGGVFGGLSLLVCALYFGMFVLAFVTSAVGAAGRP
jgi:hypothetical protein